MEIGLPEYLIADHAQPNPDQLMCQKGCNFLLLLCGIANSGLVGAGLQIPPIKALNHSTQNPFLLTYHVNYFYQKFNELFGLSGMIFDAI